MITKQQFADEFSELAYDAGIEETCALEFPRYMSARHAQDGRSYAEVDPWALHFCFAPEVLELPWEHRRGLIMHELGHVLCRELPDGGTERDADIAAEEVFGEKIIYDKRWPGKGLQCVRCERSNPPIHLEWLEQDARFLDFSDPYDVGTFRSRVRESLKNLSVEQMRQIAADLGSPTKARSAKAVIEAIVESFQRRSNPADERVLGRANPTYALYHRPASPTHVPPGYKEFGTHPDFKFGTVTYDESLSREEMDKWSLIDVSSSPGDVASKVADSLSKYSDEYLEMAEEKPRQFEAIVGQRIDRLRVHADRGVVSKLVLNILQRRENPPFSGYDPKYFRKPLPKDPTKVSYPRKRDVLNVFLDWNRGIVDDYGGESMKHSPESFEAINHRFGLEGKRRVDTIAKALWVVLPAGSPYYMEDIDVDLLNETAPAVYNERGLAFSIPDYAEERRLLEKELEYYESKYGDTFPDEDDEVPF